jgi:hypothetical protein
MMPQRGGGATALRLAAYQFVSSVDFWDRINRIYKIKQSVAGG